MMELFTLDAVIKETTEYRFVSVARTNGVLHSQVKTWYETTILTYFDRKMEFARIKCTQLCSVQP